MGGPPMTLPPRTQTSTRASVKSPMADPFDKIDTPAPPPLPPPRSGPGSPPDRPPRGAAVARWLSPASIFVILIGFFALRGEWVMPRHNALNPDRLVFTS